MQIKIGLKYGVGLAYCLAIMAFSAPAKIPSDLTLKPSFLTDGINHFDKIMSMEEIPGKPGSFLVCEALTGNIWLLAPGTTTYSKTLFANIATNKMDADLGLAGIAFHPNFISNRKYYVKFGDPNDFVRTLRVDERTATTDYLKDSGSLPRTILLIKQPDEFRDHNGGGMLFGNDGYLYLGVGDGGWDIVTADKYGNGQNRESLLGKILRIDVNRQDPGLAYAIPNDNPFANDANAKVRREIFAYGIRNPFRMTMDRMNGKIYVADVGLDKFEKVYLLRNGANYGWKLQEYTFCFTPGTCDGIVVDKPAGYASFGPVKCFIGGHIYRGNAQSAFYGAYLFGDYTMKRILAFNTDSIAPVVVTDLMASPMEMTGFTLDSQNNLYMIGYFGTIYKIEHPDLKSGVVSSIGIKTKKVVILSGRDPFYRARNNPNLLPVNLFSLNGKRLPSQHRGLAILAPTP